MCMYRYTKEHGIEIGGYTYPVGQEDQGSATVCNQQGESRHCRLLPTSTMGAGMTKKNKKKITQASSTDVCHVCVMA
jgi:hypothetical protein